MSAVNDNPAAAVERRVTVTAWPEATYLRVEDAERGFLIDQYEAADPEAGLAGDASATYLERAQDAIARSESDQAHLRELLQDRGLLTDEEATVQLVFDNRRRDRLEHLLDEHGISLLSLEPHHLPRTIAFLEKLPLERLFTLLCAWIREVEPYVEREAPTGRWYADAAPDKHCYYRTAVGYPALARWVSEDAPLDPPALRAAAYQAFVDDVDRPLERFHFGVLLRAIYFSRSEFADRPFLPAALEALLPSA
jgi:hypothetical protein